MPFGTPLMSPTLENASGLDAARTPNSLLPGPVSIVMLVYNEAEVVEHVVRGFHDEVVRLLPGSEFIVAEDGSRDGTTEILER